MNQAWGRQRTCNGVFFFPVIAVAYMRILKVSFRFLGNSVFSQSHMHFSEWNYNYKGGLITEGNTVVTVQSRVATGPTQRTLCSINTMGIPMGPETKRDKGKYSLWPRSVIYLLLHYLKADANFLDRNNTNEWRRPANTLVSAARKCALSLSVAYHAISDHRNKGFFSW